MEWSLLIVIIIILALILALTWSLLPVNTVTPQKNTSNSIPQQLNSHCDSSISCQENLTCDSKTMTCKIALNNPCTSLSECVTEATVCNGTCIIGNPGNLGEPCPCNANLTCVIENNTPICKKSANQPCTSDSECFSDMCNQNSKCSSGKLPSNRCFVGECASNLVCDESSGFGFCQKPGFISGKEGSNCIIGSPWPPTSASTNSGCDQGLICVNNICAKNNTNLGFLCNSSIPCAPPLICSNIYDSSDQTQITLCTYPENPNSCSETGVCGFNNLCINNECIPNNLQPCSLDIGCSNGSLCMQSDALFYWDMASSQWSFVTDCPYEIINMIAKEILGVNYVFAVFSEGIYTFFRNSWVPSLLNTSDVSYIGVAFLRITGLDNLINLQVIELNNSTRETSIQTLFLDLSGKKINLTDNPPAVNSINNPIFPEYISSYLPKNSNTEFVGLSAISDIDLFEIYVGSADDNIYGQVNVFPVGPINYFLDIIDNKEVSNGQNIAYTATYQDNNGINYGIVVQFIGNKKGIVYPLQESSNFNVYETFNFSVGWEASISSTGKVTSFEQNYWVLATVNSGNPILYLIQENQERVFQTTIPGYVSTETKLAALGSKGLYATFSGKCSK